MVRALLDWESGEIVRWIDVEAKNVGCLLSLSPFPFCFNIFFCRGILVWYGYKEVITCRVSFDIPTKLYGSPQTLFQVRMVLPEFIFLKIPDTSHPQVSYF